MKDGMKSLYEQNALNILGTWTGFQEEKSVPLEWDSTVILFLNYHYSDKLKNQINSI